MMVMLHKKLLAEMLGTFALVFAGTAAIVVNDQTGALTHLGIALTFGLVVFALIAALGDISGCHINPAVTVAFWLARRFPGTQVLPYLAMQSLGALGASVLVRFLFPHHEGLGGTIPKGSLLQSWILEFLLTAGLMFVVLSVSTGAKEKGITAGLAIGSVVALEALFAGPICGASMNPARSLGPALVAGRTEVLWLYLTAPFLGACSAVLTCRCVREPSCCCAPVGEPSS